VHWTDRGILIAIRKFGETDQIASFVTASHGLAHGLVKGGISRRQKPYLQAGNAFDMTWKSRLEEQLGFFSLEPVKVFGAEMFSSPDSLAMLSSACALLYDSMSENTPAPRIYEITDWLLGNLTLYNYMLWERELLAALGFSLSLECCNATGATDDLCYISPKTGHAVCRSAGEPYRDRLLKMPEIWSSGTGDIGEALRVLEYFFIKHIYSEKSRPYPYIRRSLCDGLRKAA
jgi:DNA repair protein RecO (recombination protein O)